MIDQLQPWAKKQAEQANYKTIGIYLGVVFVRRRRLPLRFVLTFT